MNAKRVLNPEGSTHKQWSSLGSSSIKADLLSPSPLDRKNGLRKSAIYISHKLEPSKKPNMQVYTLKRSMLVPNRPPMQKNNQVSQL